MVDGAITTFIIIITTLKTIINGYAFMQSLALLESPVHAALNPITENINSTMPVQAIGGLAGFPQEKCQCYTNLDIGKAGNMVRYLHELSVIC